MVLSKRDKEQLIDIEKCERAAKKEKLLEKLRTAREKIEKPYTEKIRKLEDERTKAIIDAGLLYINDGCGRCHPDIEVFNLETNKIIKSILRE